MRTAPVTRRFSISALGAFLLLAGCATIQTSPLNPLTWFGGTGGSAAAAADDVPPPLVPQGVARPPDPRLPVARVSSVSLDRTSESVLVTARAQTSAPGHYNAALVPAGVENGYLILEFRAEPPPRDVSGQASLTAGYVLDAARAAGLRGLRVVAAQNALTQTF